MRTRRSRKDRTGRTQRRRSHTGRARRPNLSAYYGRKLAAITPGEFEFELRLLRGRGAASLALDRFVESFEWLDEETALTGSVQLRRPDPEDHKSLPLARGHRIRCRVKWGAKWYELWTMRCDAPEVSVEEGRITVTLNDDLDLVRRGRRRYLFRATKRRKHGYFGHEALRLAARRDGIKLGRIAKCKHRMKKIDVRGSFLDLVLAIYKHERQTTGRRFVVRIRNGRLEVVPYKRNPILYVLASQIRTAVIAQTPKVANPATVIIGTARLGKGKATKKIRHTEYRRDIVQRFGRVEKRKDYGHVASLSELRAKIKRDLAAQVKVDQQITVQHQGIPFIARGDGAQVVLPSEAMTGERSFVFVRSGRHQVQGGTYTSEWVFVRDDPFEADRKAREKAARDRKRRARAKRRRGSH